MNTSPVVSIPQVALVNRYRMETGRRASLSGNLYARSYGIDIP